MSVFLDADGADFDVVCVAGALLRAVLAEEEKGIEAGAALGREAVADTLLFWADTRVEVVEVAVEAVREVEVDEEVEEVEPLDDVTESVAIVLALGFSEAGK